MKFSDIVKKHDVGGIETSEFNAIAEKLFASIKKCPYCMGSVELRDKLPFCVNEQIIIMHCGDMKVSK